MGPQTLTYGVGDTVREPAYGASASQNCQVRNSPYLMAACLLQRKNVLYVDLSVESTRRLCYELSLSN